MSNLDVQHGGRHYKELAIQPIEYIHKNKLGYFEGTAIKYLSRFRLKGKPTEDLLKAIHFIQLLLEMEYGVKTEFRELPETTTTVTPTYITAKPGLYSTLLQNG